MAGELNGTLVLIKKAGTDLVGQGEMTMTVGGTPIDISNKSYGDYVTYLDDALSAKQIVLSGTITYNNNTAYEALRADAMTGSQDDYTIVYAATGEQITAKFVPTGMSDALPLGGAVTTTVSLNSSGTYTYTPAT